MKKQLIALSAIIIFITSCGPKIYKTADFSDKTSSHKIVAILPTEVNIQLRPNEMKKTTPEQISQSEESTGKDIQDKMYSWFLKRSDKFKYTVAFQDISKTNALLSKAGITYTTMGTKTKEELCQLLGVDAVISSRASMKKPMSEGAAVAVGLLVGAWGNTNDVQTSISINEGKNGELIWKYDYQASGSVGSSSSRLVDGLMRNASKKFPYNGK
ncbi:MAG: hypothetical protein JST86_10220 [Bacteroidetes bacterium]|nr:hypothetical protein [Bacteroidota bacterium]